MFLPVECAPATLFNRKSEEVALRELKCVRVESNVHNVCRGKWDGGADDGNGPLWVGSVLPFPNWN